LWWRYSTPPPHGRFLSPVCALNTVPLSTPRNGLSRKHRSSFERENLCAQHSMTIMYCCVRSHRRGLRRKHLPPASPLALWPLPINGCCLVDFSLSLPSNKSGNTWIYNVVLFTPRPLYLLGKSPRYLLDRRLGGPQSLSGRYGEMKILD
jgi:hypothetical protein